VETDRDISEPCGCNLCRNGDLRRGAGEQAAGGHRRIGWADGSPFGRVSGACGQPHAGAVVRGSPVTLAIGDITESRHRAVIIVAVAFAVALIAAFVVAVTFS
jgi:hypothetical protein